MIVCRGLTKQFKVYKKHPGLLGSLRSLVRRDVQLNAAVDAFDLTVGQGEIVGLLGPNGAGKTTLMKMFTGIIVPTGGELTVMGHQPARRALDFRRRIALVMGQKSQLWWDIPAMDSFLLLRRYYELDDAVFKRRLAELAELLGVAKLMNVHVRKLSLGERMKLELMACLLHEPEVMFLDEPTIGLDVVAQQNIREFLLAYQRRCRTTIILTSHYMADVEALCERVVLIHGGTKRFDGPLAAFAALLGRDKVVTLTFAAPVDPADPAWAPLTPRWQAGHTRVELRIAEPALRATLAGVLERFPVTDLATAATPVERVMAALLARPELAKAGAGVV